MNRVWAYLAILATAAGLYVVGRAEGAASVATAAAVEGAQTELAAGKAYRARDRVLLTQAQAARARAVSYAEAESTAEQNFEQLARAFHAHLDSNHASVDTAAFRLVYRACYDALTLCKLRGDTLAWADSLDRLRADSNAIGWARADSSLQQLLKVKTCHILFVACPSRTLTFLVAGAGGAVLGWYAHR